MISDLIKKLSRNPLQPLQDNAHTLALAQNLKRIRTDLLADRNNAVEIIVEFFDAVSATQDALPLNELLADLTKADRKGKYTGLLGNLHALRVHLTNAGRQPHGMNRTVRGQRVTPNDVYLGGVYGYFTKTAAYVKGQRTVNPEFYQICNTQAANFMWSHFPMIDLCERIVAAVV